MTSLLSKLARRGYFCLKRPPPSSTPGHTPSSGWAMAGCTEAWPLVHWWPLQACTPLLGRWASLQPLAPWRAQPPPAPPQAGRGARRDLGRQSMTPELSRNKQRCPFLGRADSWGPGWGESPAGRVSGPDRSPAPPQFMARSCWGTFPAPRPSSSSGFWGPVKGAGQEGAPQRAGHGQLLPGPTQSRGRGQGEWRTGAPEAQAACPLPCAPRQGTGPHTRGIASKGTCLLPLSLVC